MYTSAQYTHINHLTRHDFLILFIASTKFKKRTHHEHKNGRLQNKNRAYYMPNENEI